MNTTWHGILLSVILFGLGCLMGRWMDHWPSFALGAEGESQAKFLRLMAHQTMGNNLLFSAYCDAERGHLIYTYTVAAGESPSGDLSVVKDGCQGGK